MVDVNNLNELIYGGESLVAPSSSQDQIVELPLNEIYDKTNHTFNSYRNRPDWADFVESIRMHGVQQPVLVRSNPCNLGKYESIAGHRRRAGAAEAGLTTIPAIIKEMDDNTANISMVITNLHRPDWSPAERARSWKVLYESFKAQGHRSDLSASEGPSAEEKMEQITGQSIRTVQRIIKLCDLIDPLMELVDEKKIPELAGHYLAFLTKENQSIVLDIIDEFGPINTDAAMHFRDFQNKGIFSYDKLAAYLKNDLPQPAAFKLTEKEIKDWFPADYTGTASDKKKLIQQLLEDHFGRRG